MKWLDANGTDVDAYPDRAFHGGVYEGGIMGRPEPIRVTGAYGQRVTLQPKAEEPRAADRND